MILLESYFFNQQIWHSVLQNEHNDEFAVPFDADLECKTHVIVYDGCTSSLDDDTFVDYSKTLQALRCLRVFDVVV